MNEKIHALHYDQSGKTDFEGAYQVHIVCPCGWKQDLSINFVEAMAESPFQIIVARYESHISQ